MNLKLLLLFCSFWTVTTPENPLSIENIPPVEDKLTLHVYDAFVAEGETISIDFYSSNFEDILGFQVPLSLSNAEFNYLAGGSVPLTAQHYNFVEDESQLRISWNTLSNIGINISNTEILFSISITAKKDLEVSELFSIDETFMSSEAIKTSFTADPIDLDFTSLPQTPNSTKDLTLDSKVFPNVFNKGKINCEVKDMNIEEAILYSFKGERLGLLNVDGTSIQGEINTSGIYLIKIFDGQSYHNELITVN